MKHAGHRPIAVPNIEDLIELLHVAASMQLVALCGPLWSTPIDPVEIVTIRTFVEGVNQSDRCQVCTQILLERSLAR